ncbi:TPA: fimbrial biogenesis chaperone [Morganella morganii]
MPSQSRVIYHPKDREQTLMLANSNDYPVIIQTWVDKGEGSPDTPNVPFISMPPITRLDPGDMKGVRIIYNKGELPEDRESLFWFNMYEVPPEKKGNTPENSVLVAMNTQIKLFYRPEGITSTPETAFPKVFCKKVSDSKVSCSNPEPIHLSVISMALETKSGQQLASKDGDFMLLPFSERMFNFPKTSDLPIQITADYIDDYGAKQVALIKNIR